MRAESSTGFRWQRLAVYACIALLYLWQRGRHPGFHDSLSYLLDAATHFSGDTNATNHFLYNNFQHVLVLILPFIDPVLILSMVSVVFSLLSLLRLEQVANLFTKDRGAALLAMATFAVSFTWWQQTETIEVYTFNTFFFLSFFYFGLKELQFPHKDNINFASLLLGICLLIHIQNILCIPFFLFLVFRRNHHPLWLKGYAFITPLVFASALFVGPLTIHNHAVSAVFFDSQFQKDVMGFDLRAIGTGLVKAVAFFAYNFHLWIIMLVVGKWWLWKHDRKKLLQLSILLLPFLAFAVKYSVSDNHVFYISIFAVFAAASAKAWELLILRKPRLWIPAVVTVLLLSPLLYFTTTQVVKRLPAGRKLDQEKAYKGGVAHYTFPGRRNLPDPLEAAKAWERNPDSVEWNIQPAIRYNHLPR